jgi:hypothetical protein
MSSYELTFSPVCKIPVRRKNVTKNSNGLDPRQVSVVAIDELGKFYVFPAISSCAKALSVNRVSVSHCCSRNKCLSSGSFYTIKGYRIFYERDYIIWSALLGSPYLTSHFREVVSIDDAGVLSFHASMSQAARDLNSNKKNIHRCCIRNQGANIGHKVNGKRIFFYSDMETWCDLVNRYCSTYTVKIIHMHPILKPNVKLTLLALEAGDHVTFSLTDVTEVNVRSACSRLTSSDDRQYSIEREYPNLKVTRLR